MGRAFPHRPRIPPTATTSRACAPTRTPAWSSCSRSSAAAAGNPYGAWSARRINKPDGSFGGTVLAAILIDQLDELLARIRLQASDSIALRGVNLGLIARYPSARTINVPLGDTKVSASFVERLQADPQEGTYSATTAVNGVSRIHSYRRSAKYGFLVNVGIASQTALAEWRQQAAVISGLFLAFVLAALAMARLIDLGWRRREEAMAALQASERALHKAPARSPASAIIPTICRPTAGRAARF